MKEERSGKSNLVDLTQWLLTGKLDHQQAS